jgi:lysophospholipase L1-like esterase
MYALADAICDRDFSYQDEQLNFNVTTIGFTENLTLLKSIDFNNVDMITIAYGTNDYTGGSFLGERTEFDVFSVCGALKYAIKRIQTTYPHIKILVITPIWRYFGEIGSEEYVDSDTHNPNGTGTLRDFADAIISASKLMRVPVLESYSNLSISQYNCTNLMVDKTHLNDAGRKLYGELISGKIRTLY